MQFVTCEHWYGISSLDIDVIDPSLAPATGTPEPGTHYIFSSADYAIYVYTKMILSWAAGWTPRELHRIIRGLAGLNFVSVAILFLSFLLRQLKPHSLSYEAVASISLKWPRRMIRTVCWRLY